ESWGLGEKLDAGELVVLGALAGAEEDEAAGGAPGEGVAARVGEEGDLSGFAAAAGGDDLDVLETFRADAGIGDPVAGGGEGEGGGLAVEGGAFEHLVGDEGPLLLGDEVEEADFLVVVLVGEGVAVGGEARAGVVVAGGEAGLLAGGEVVEVDAATVGV